VLTGEFVRSHVEESPEHHAHEKGLDLPRCSESRAVGSPEPSGDRFDGDPIALVLQGLECPVLRPPAYFVPTVDCAASTLLAGASSARM
jgi:hypothetical protein